MNTKLLAGSVAAGLGVFAAVVNEWAGHLFFALYHVARAESLESAGSFDPGPYGAGPASAGVALGTQVAIWLLVSAGFALLAWGAWEERTERDGRVSG